MKPNNPTPNADGELTKAERWDYNRLKKLESDGRDQYLKMRKAKILSTDAVLAFINQLSPWNLKTTGVSILEAYCKSRESTLQRQAELEVIDLLFWKYKELNDQSVDSKFAEAYGIIRDELTDDGALRQQTGDNNKSVPSQEAIIKEQDEANARLIDSDKPRMPNERIKKVFPEQRKDKQ